jgi:hypothetical protein
LGRLVPFASGRQSSFPFGRVGVPGPFWRAFHESNGGNERVQKARIMALAGNAAKVIVHFIWVTTWQVTGRRDPQPAQIGSDGGANIRDLFKTGKLFAISSISIG